MNVFIDIDIDIDIFKSDLIDIDIDIDIFKKCRYIDNRYGLSIYRTPLLVIHQYISGVQALQSRMEEVLGGPAGLRRLVLLVACLVFPPEVSPA